ncbi:hypothetical protein ANO11243_085340 [Dothideomycetidae sp. 11243]|nr:hypothetical protein ANO11243_085340 [fungal sp. No.11243]
MSGGLIHPHSGLGSVQVRYAGVFLAEYFNIDIDGGEERGIGILVARSPTDAGVFFDVTGTVYKGFGLDVYDRCRIRDSPYLIWESVIRVGSIATTGITRLHDLCRFHHPPGPQLTASVSPA